MQHINDVLKWLGAAIGAAVGWFGGWSPILTALVAFLTMDYFTGLIVAWRGKSPKTENGGLSSKAAFDGLVKKMFIIMVVFMSTVLDKALGTDKAMFQSAVICYYIASEGLSLIENLALMDVPIPDVLKKALEIFRKKGDGPEGPSTDGAK